ncbi:hypothetical protein AGMMS49525_16200 [Bacteroidia bacterium]|nr:hypothetical protein AGMMS49525_16200 [Bacteroidia bacterium]
MSTIPTGSSGDKEFWARWTPPLTFIVTFDGNGGSAIAPLTIGEYEKIPKPADPTRPGFTFGGWYSNNTAYDFDTRITEATTLTAKWIKYTVIFNSREGSTVPSQTVEQHGATVTKPVDPTRTGYSFAGWYYEEYRYGNGRCP